MIGSAVSARLIRRRARLAKKLAKVRAKLARYSDGATSYRVIDSHGSLVSAIRSISYVVLWGGFWWLGSDKIHSIVDEIFGPEERYVPVDSASPAHAGQTFWTFGRRMRSGQSRIDQP